MTTGRAEIRTFPTSVAASPWRLGGLTVAGLGRRVLHEIGDDEVTDRAAALSYYFLFALFPTLMFLMTLLAMLPVGNLVELLLDYLGRALPPDASSVITKTVGEIVTGARGGLLSVGAVGALWAASAGMESIITSLNVVYDVTDPRPFWKRRLVAVGLTVVFSLFTLTALILMVIGPKIADTVARLFGMGPVFTAAWNIIQWPVAIMLALCGVNLVYYLAPAVKQRWYWVTPGSVFALAGWLLTSAGLRFYVAHFANYNVTYGSIGGVILLLLWLYLTGAVLLIGAEINAEIAHAAAERGTPTVVPSQQRQPGRRSA